MAPKIASLVVVLCIVASVFAAPSPKSVVNADDNDVAVEKSVIDANAGSDSSVISPLPPSNGHPGRKPQNFYNDIFNIPTSILNAVSRLLTGGGSGGSGTSSFGGAGVGAGAGAGGSHVGARIGDTGAAAGVSFGNGQTLGASASNGGIKTGTGTGSGFFNDIFNIPITALNAVNQLLNNNQKNAGK